MNRITWFVILILATVIFLNFVVIQPHKHLSRECRARGGVYSSRTMLCYRSDAIIELP